ncbi:MAG TPA: metallophosphoesterase [Actinomycetota bacterium]|nr:metallophosphoesterase [Actinomycetota bacterium]
MIRIAAVADIHFGEDSAGMLLSQFEGLREHADVLLVAGDLTKRGGAEEGAVVARELAVVPVPVIAVLGNHDYHSDEQDSVRKCLEDAGVTVLEGERSVVEVDGVRLGVAGTKGFGGGFAGACATDFGEPEMKAFVRHTMGFAERLEDQLRSLDGCDVRVALLHYSPVRDTLAGERAEIFPFLGSYLLAEAIDHAGADLAIHGHAHAGVEKGVTPGGVLVRNVAQPVIKHAYNVYTFEASRVPAAEARA